MFVRDAPQSSICETPSSTFQHSNISFVKSVQNTDRCETLELNAVVTFPPCSLYPSPMVRSLATLHEVLVSQVLLPFAPRSRQLYSVGNEEN